MEGTYDVMLGALKMGTVTVARRGLYWQFSCRCRLSGETMQELMVTLGEQSVKLGLLTPTDGVFGLDTKIAAKRLGEGRPAFSLHPRHGDLQGLFVPLRPEEPFAYLSKLESAVLARHRGEWGLVLPQEK